MGKLPKSSSGAWIFKGVLIAVLIAAVAAFLYFDLGRFLSLESLRGSKDTLQRYTNDHYSTAAMLFIVLYCLQTALSLPGAAILTLAGGFLFGAVLGTIYVNIGATSGAVLAFLAARYLFRDLIERKFGKRLEAIQTGFVKNAFHYLLTLRLIPVFPFFLINLACGLTRVRLGTFVIATAVGIAPASFIFANTGKQLGTINSLKEISSPNVIGAFILLGILSLAPVAYKKWKGGALPDATNPPA